MKKILFIGRNYKNKIKNGSSEVTKRNKEILSELFIIEEILLDYNISYLKKIKDILFCNSINFKKEVKELLRINIKQEKYTYVWIDNSLYGSIAKFIKKIDSNIKIIIFFHNIEYLYFKDKVKIEGVKNLIMLPYCYINEKRSLKFSDKILVLNSRDDTNLNQIYYRKSNLIIPLTLRDKYKENKIKDDYENKIPRGLFVGSNFFANTHGINWFIDNVLPELNIELIIVGSGMEKFKKKYENKNKKIEVLGFVEKIEEEYGKADFIISPIFKGSGMKTKITEALMYGKTIFGTSESFEGFDNLDYNKIGGICNSKEEFIKKIKNYKIQNKVNIYSREIYIKNYSNSSIIEKLKKVIW